MTAEETIPRHVPWRAVVLSIAALAVPVLSAVVLPDFASEDYGLILWLAALVPAFLMAYYRGFQGAALAVAGGMAVLSLTQALVSGFGLGNPNWGVLLAVVIAYLGITAALAIFAELLHRERRAVEALALSDQLTGIPNRRHAELILEREFAAAMRGRPLCVVAYDVDKFKVFNDTHGHAAGDEVLQSFAEVLDTSTRRKDLSARFGGEEFMTILSETSTEQAHVFADRVREQIKQKELRWGTVTVSAGVAPYREGMGSYHVLLAAADRALYAAKEAGRDRVMIATEEEPRRSRVSAPRVPTEEAGTVLIVDDDAEGRRELVRVLRGHGFEAQETGSPEEAISLFRDGVVSIDLLITNVMMPRTSGFTLVDRISEIDPDVKVVYLSDSMRERVSWSGAPGLTVRYVSKPIEEDNLLTTVREAIADDESGGLVA